MPDTPTPGQRAWLAYHARLHALMEQVPLDYPRPFGALSAAQRAAWEAAAQAVRERDTPAVLYIVVAHADGQIQLCGAYPHADEADSHLAHATTRMPAHHYEVRVCPAWRPGQVHRSEDPTHA